MRRVLPVTVLAAGLLLTSACADTGPLEVRYELTGDPGVTVQPLVGVPTEDGARGTPRTITDAPVPLPWQQTLVVERGETTIEATPAQGALTCRIVVEGREAARVTGGPGQKVTCRGDVDE